MKLSVALFYQLNPRWVDMAKATGISRNSLHLIFKGLQKPRPDTIRTINAYLSQLKSARAAQAKKSPAAP